MSQNQQQTNFIKLSKWCIDNSSVDYLTMLKLCRKYELPLYKIGADYFVESEESIKLILRKFQMEQQVLSTARRDQARKRAAQARKRDEAIITLLAQGIIPDELDALTSYYSKLRDQKKEDEE